MRVVIGTADFPGDREVVAELLSEYADALDFDLGFQSFADEVTNLPEDNARPSGVVLLGEMNGSNVSRVAMQRKGSTVHSASRIAKRIGTIRSPIRVSTNCNCEVTFDGRPNALQTGGGRS
jgi:hypothetical protein